MNTVVQNNLPFKDLENSCKCIVLSLSIIIEKTEQFIVSELAKFSIERGPLDQIKPRTISKTGYLKQTTFYIFYVAWSDNVFICAWH